MELSSWVIEEGNASQHPGLLFIVWEEGATGTVLSK